MKKLLLAGLFFLSVTFIFWQLSLSYIHVTGTSMEPNIPNDAYILAVEPKDISRFDVVTFKAPDEEDATYIKRVVGLPGDVIEFSQGILYISGQGIDEKYLTGPKGKIYTEDFSLYHGCGQIIVPPDYYFVLGDNRPASNDSRRFGFIHQEAVKRKATFILWPPEFIGNINKEHQQLAF